MSVGGLPGRAGVVEVSGSSVRVVVTVVCVFALAAVGGAGVAQAELSSAYLLVPLLVGAGWWIGGRQAALLTPLAAVLSVLPVPGRLIVACLVVSLVAVSRFLWRSRDASSRVWTPWAVTYLGAASLLVVSFGLGWLGSESRSGGAIVTILAAVASLGFTLLIAVTVSPVAYRRLFHVMVVASVGAAVLVIVRAASGGDLTGLAGGYSAAKTSRFESLGDVNGLSQIVMVGVPLLAAAAIGMDRRRSAVIGLAIVAGALLVLLSRAAILGAACGMLIVCLTLLRVSVRRVAAMVAGLAGLGLLLAPSIQDIAADTGSVRSRGELWDTAAGLISARPVAGYGPERWYELTSAAARWTPPGGGGGTHNTMLSIGLAGGLLAIVAASVLLALTGARLLAGVRRSRALPMQAALVAGIAGAFVAQMVRGAFEASGWPTSRLHDFSGWPAFLLAILAGLALASPRLSGSLATADGLIGARQRDRPGSRGVAARPHD